MGNPEKPSLLVVPGLTPPYAGVVDEIKREYSSNGAAFINRAKSTLEKENPSLAKTFGRFLEKSPIPEYSQKWALTYYEIFSRSGRKAGLPLAYFVSDKLLDATSRGIAQGAINSLEISSEAFSLYVEKMNNKRKEARLKDEETNPELKKFWQSVDEDVKKLIEEEYDYHDVVLAMVGVEEFQIILQENNEQYQLSDKYLKVNPLKDRI